MSEPAVRSVEDHEAHTSTGPAGPRRHRRGRRLLAAGLVAALGCAVAAVLLWPSSTGGTTPRAAPAAEGGGGAGAVAARTVPLPGQVGFLGDRAALNVIDPSTTTPVGSEWVHGVLRVDATNLVLDHVLVRGGIDWYGAGTLTIRDSVVLGGPGGFAVVEARTPAGLVQITDSTLSWSPDVPVPTEHWGSGVVNGDSMMDIERSDLSGAPDGIQQGTGRSRFVQNYIHDLAMFGTPPDNSHNDGIQLYEGPGIQVLYNRIELRGYDGAHQNSAVFLAGGPGYDGPEVVGNYLSGGGYPLRIESGARAVVVEDNVFGPLDGGFGQAYVRPGASVGRWTGNVDPAGVPVQQPAQG